MLQLQKTKQCYNCRRSLSQRQLSRSSWSLYRVVRYIHGSKVSQQSSHTGVPDFKKNVPPWEPTVGICLGTYGGPRGVDVFLWARYPCSLPPARVAPRRVTSPIKRPTHLGAYRYGEIRSELHHAQVRRGMAPRDLSITGVLHS
jgi:hypothetical protein